MTEQTYHGALPLGSYIESYQIAGVLGIGGFGITYKGYDHSLHCDVAIKEYLPHGLALRTGDGVTVIPKSQDDKKYYEYGLKRFLDEARTLAKFKERSIVRVTRFLETNGTAYLIMDYEDGESLAQYLQRNGVLNEEQVRAVFIPILEGLRAVHAKDFLHRDIKPGNIYLRKDGPPVLLDFGAARNALGERTQALTGMVTPGYAPFEQYNSRSRQGPWTDLYALGATLYHCITGKAPPEAPDRIAALQDHEPDPLVPAQASGKSRYSGALLQTVDWMLAPNAKDRPQTIDAVLARLQGDGPAPSPAATWPKTQPLAATQRLEAPTSQPPAITRDELEAFKACRSAAEGGDAAAQFRLGLMYAYGRGTSREEEQAAAWLRKAAEQNHVPAQAKLGLMLARGQGMAKDEAGAAVWLHKAADKNDVTAQFNLGMMYVHGVGVAKDTAQAQSWYRKAAAQGHAGAQANLAVITARARRGSRAWIVWGVLFLLALAGVFSFLPRKG